ncbi:hypothetical protein FQR65_LT20219 [Abscondita terminalis]|nr:hypothetical protein FQR65_LT20219 [Abscondita terminalis]
MVQPLNAAWQSPGSAKTALVDRPVAMMTATAFFELPLRVTISPARTFSSSGLAMVTSTQSRPPGASNCRRPLVFAVYIPPQEPAAMGRQLRSITSRSLLVDIRPQYSPTAQMPNDGQVFTFPVAWFDGAAVYIDTRYVGAQHRDHAAWHILVAATDDQHAVHPWP